VLLSGAGGGEDGDEEKADDDAEALRRSAASKRKKGKAMAGPKDQTPKGGAGLEAGQEDPAATGLEWMEEEGLPEEVPGEDTHLRVLGGKEEEEGKGPLLTEAEMEAEREEVEAQLATWRSDAPMVVIIIVMLMPVN
jgi:hypothetical protein